LGIPNGIYNYISNVVSFIWIKKVYIIKLGMGGKRNGKEQRKRI